MKFSFIHPNLWLLLPLKCYMCNDDDDMQFPLLTHFVSLTSLIVWKMVSSNSSSGSTSKYVPR